MTRKKIAFIVEPHFMLHHIGVRNYFYSLYNLLGKTNQVDFVSHYLSKTGRPHWYRIVPKSHELIVGNIPSENPVFRGTPTEVLRQSHSRNTSSHQVTPDDFHHSHIGSDLSVENYDVGIITNPWLVSFTDPLPCKKLAGIVYDTVPNQYVFSREDKPLAFASHHQTGFTYYRQYCDCVFGISEKASTDFASLFKMDRSLVHTLPPLLPTSYQSIDHAINDRPKRVLLASPFDLRKGLAKMPAVLNVASSEIDQLSIYGSIRCSSKDVAKFFTELKVSNVEWYPAASASKVNELFLNSKVLFFPSLDEGLGLPILESQFCGCPTLVRDKSPMNQLVGPGHRYITDSPQEDGATLCSMLREPFDHSYLQSWAHREFNFRNVENVLDETLEINHPTLAALCA